MGYKTFLKQLFPKSHNVDAAVYDAILGAIGYAIDQYDPVQTNLVSAFSVTTAVGSDLDLQGNDYQASRRNGESDSAYRIRILSLLPTYTLCPSLPGISAVVTPFTGTAPTIFEYGPGAFVMGESTIGDAGFTSPADIFTLELHVQNPSNLSYNHQDMEFALSKAKLSRSTIILYHNGTDTSPLGEASNAVITITV